MEKTEIVIKGDTQGVEWKIPVLRFAGGKPDAPKVYIQAALHAGELPGVAALHFFIPMLEEAEKRGEVLGDIVIVPKANPIGAAQYVSGELQGRFEHGSRVNFNRDFPLVPWPDRETLKDNIAQYHAPDQMKRHLLSMAIEADLVLDLHCDDESVIYAYLEESFWPAATDLAESFGLKAVLLSDGDSSAFEDAVTHAWRNGPLGNRKSWHEGRISLTMEFRGLSDVYADIGREDAEGLMSFLRRRGAVAGEPSRREPFEGAVAGLDYVQMVNAPAGGMLLFEREIGTSVKAGDRLATIVTAPGDPAHDIVVAAPVDGEIVTRVHHRIVRRGDNLMKIASTSLSHTPRKPGGGLED